MFVVLDEKLQDGMKRASESFSEYMRILLKESEDKKEPFSELLKLFKEDKLTEETLRYYCNK